MVFTPNVPTIIVAKYICMCQLCKNDCGSCQVFKEYTQNVHRTNKINLRSNYDDYDECRSKNTDSEDEDEFNEFLEPGSICAKAASEHSADTVWFIKIIGEFGSTAVVTDDYEHKVTSGQKYMVGHFLEKVNDNITSKKYKLIENDTIFFHESIAYLVHEVGAKLVSHWEQNMLYTKS